MPVAARGAYEQMLVHNLKTPLTGILASLEMLHDGDHGVVTPSQRSAIALMQSQGAELLAMIDELLDLGRLQSSGVPVEPVAVALDGFLDRVLAEWQPRLGGRLTSDVAPGLPGVLADPVVLHRVIGNLLMNALVHGGPGVRVRVVAEPGGPDRITLLVADDGPGIAAPDVERVFEPFVRLDSAVVRGRGTSGLGLAYCRAAVSAMGGTIAVVPATSGTTIRIDLPAASPRLSPGPAR